MSPGNRRHEVGEGQFAPNKISFGQAIINWPLHRKGTIMLVLTRRKDQKVLFPNLGISVEIVDVKGNTVRLGIDAPKDIRIVRDEIECFEHPPANANSEFQPQPRESRASNESHTFDEQTRRRLDAANLAIHLARNQIRQGLDHMADEALDQALQCLQQVENLLGKPADRELVSAVHESTTGYAVSKKSERVLVLEQSKGLANGLVNRLSAVRDKNGTTNTWTLLPVDSSKLVPSILDPSTVGAVILGERPADSSEIPITNPLQEMGSFQFTQVEPFASTTAQELPNRQAAIWFRPNVDPTELLDALDV